MIAATFLAIFFVPLFFKFITDRRLGESRTKAELVAEIAHARTVAHLAPPATPGHPPRGPASGDRHE